MSRRMSKETKIKALLQRHEDYKAKWWQSEKAFRTTWVCPHGVECTPIEKTRKINEHLNRTVQEIMSIAQQA